MKTTVKTLTFLVAVASLPMAAMAQTTAPDKAAPPKAGSGDMMGMMSGDGMQMDGMMGQMMQMMMMMQMSQMMTDCTKMMADMSMMGKGADPMMTAPTEPAPKG